MCGSKHYPYLPYGREFFLFTSPPCPTSLEIPVKKMSNIYLNFWTFTPQEFPVPSVGVAWISSNYFELLLLPQ